jgi:hypothetical protein
VGCLVSGRPTALLSVLSTLTLGPVDWLGKRCGDEVAWRPGPLPLLHDLPGVGANAAPNAVRARRAEHEHSPWAAAARRGHRFIVSGRSQCSLPADRLRATRLGQGSTGSGVLAANPPRSSLRTLGGSGSRCPAPSASAWRCQTGSLS